MQDENHTKNILISGSSGLIGTALRERLAEAGYQVFSLSRDNDNQPFFYDQDDGEMHLDEAIPLHAVINLAGASLADGRWTDKRKRLIMDSRVVTTERLCQALVKLPHKPQVLLSASAIGYYGDTGDSTVDEDSPPGETFLAEVAKNWEQAAEPARQAGMRVVNLRFGLVLSLAGGVLPNFLLPFRLGAVGRVGSGRQYVSWIHLEDCIAAIEQLLVDVDFHGPVNVVSNNEKSNDEFTRAISQALGRPRMPPLPAAMVKLLFGEMGEEALLASSRVRSKRLTGGGITLAYGRLDRALENLLAG